MLEVEVKLHPERTGNMRDTWLAIKLALVFVLNLADYLLILTARMIESGLVREVNPVLKLKCQMKPK
jgi:hypothetical protein